jgi:hypothetical protein
LNPLAPPTTTVPLLPTDYPKVKFWTRYSWTTASKKSNDSTTVDQKAAERGGTRMANDENVTMRFVEDAEGLVIGGRRAQDIRRRMCRVFWHLADQPGGPAPTWTGYAGIKQQYYYREMANMFPELRLCQLDWKADKLAIDAYPSWYQTYMKKDRERVKQEKIKEEGPDNPVGVSVPEKRLRSPSLANVQMKKAKPSDHHPITTPSAFSVVLLPSSSTPSPKSTSTMTSATTTALFVPMTSPEPEPSVFATTDISPVSTALADQSTQDYEQAKLEGISPQGREAIGGKRKEKSSDSGVGSVVKPQPPKVCLQ